VALEVCHFSRVQDLVCARDELPHSTVKPLGGEIFPITPSAWYRVVYTMRLAGAKAAWRARSRGREAANIEPQPLRVVVGYFAITPH